MSEKSYTITINEERSRIITVILQVLLKSDTFIGYLKANGREQAFLGLMRELSDKEQEADMCRDPNCPDKKVAV